MNVPDRFAFILFAWTCAFILPPSFQAGIVVVLLVTPYALPAAFTGPDARRRFGKFVATSALLAGLIILLNGVFVNGRTVAVVPGLVSLHEEGLAFGVRVSARLLLMTASVLLVAATTPIRSIAAALRRSSVPSVVPTVLLLTLDLLDRLPARIERIHVAQESRGAPVRAGLLARMQGLLAVSGPLMVSSIVESVDRSHALTARGFRADRRHSVEGPVPLGTPGRLFLGASFILFAAGLWRRLHP